MSSSSSKKMSLKLLIDTTAERVLFAEASKEFIDFLFNMYRLPIGTVTRLLTRKGMVGSLGKLYKSIENLNDDYMLNPHTDRDLLLKPIAPVSGYLLPANDGLDDSKLTPPSLYMCPDRCKNYVTNFLGTLCPYCNSKMELPLQFVTKNATEVTDSSSEGGFVKGVVTYNFW
ncbi:uncharacterized protein LOC129292751 [Prosopis cineraria]|uniref:uncharacterized protein LOC129292751 n=1 Tax=Prosopis cineraria TaxID=364024 RepID=UPI00240FBAA7|nr:uncharacterized protein LOC129292751 [Prosopis cineraria]